MKITIIFISILILLNPPVAAAQHVPGIDSLILQGKQQLHQALNNWQKSDLLAARAFFERLAPDTTYPWLIHYYLGLADYRIVSFYFSQQQQDQAEKYIEDGIEHLKTCIQLKPEFAEAYSLLSAVYGNKIATNPMLGMSLGPQSGIMMAKALKLAPENPRSQLIAGWSAYFTPKMWGGGKDKAKKYFQQAIACFDSFRVVSPILPDWGHEEAYAWLGLLNMEQEKLEQAKINFNKALQLNPGYGWIKRILLPELQKKMTAKN